MGGIELRQNLKLSQQLIMTPRLQLAIKMLALNNIELSDMINQEILENPIVDAEEDYGKNKESSQEEDGRVESEEEFKEIAQYLVNYNEQLVDLSKSGGNHKGADNNYIENCIENSFCSGKTLYEHIMEQVRTGCFSEQEILLSEYIAGNLDSRGFLAVSIPDIEEFVSVDIANGSEEDIREFVSGVLGRIYRLEPVGLASEDVASSLTIQAEYYFGGDDLLKTIINNYLKEAANKNYQKISKETGEHIDAILSSIENLKKLNPHPGMSFGKDEPRYITPDLFLKKKDGKYVVFMNDGYIPEIRVSSYYKKILSGEIVVPQDMKNYVEERFRSALWLIKSIDTRKETILKIAQKIIDKQSDYFDKGSGDLKPLILKDIALELDIHESTVSRATSNKYLSTHIGVLELKSFFTGASYGDSSSKNVMARIKTIIDSEESAGRAFRDNEITDILKRQGIVIARRTIAKYREIMDIPSSSIRSKNIINN
ncbi:RNA polymerase factor sigma-54 [Candidatus Acidulodesulfobacterium sp. H_13]|uniref:RNA polymerase factor sigma-54 n=1 Tax=Candidatus Acidulodesulfobacterium sp. H_13 TaxID=3395470 RepID=UPI003AF67A0E